MRTLRVVATAAIALIVAGAGVALSSGGDAGQETSAGRTYRELCGALDAAADGHDAAAARHFVDRVHGPLHTLATDTAAVDRAVAGRLLEAKNQAEAAVDGNGELAAQLTALAEATREAVRTVDGDDPGRC